ncbi:hypothetical protein C9994_02255, partial [Marivirga lumbricoides]
DPGDGSGTHQKLSFEEILIDQDGYLIIFLSNESQQTVEVFWDDFRVDHHHNAVLQADDYYPFGLTFNSYRKEFSKKNKMNTFQDQEYIEETGWVQFKWRNHQPELGRFFNVDPLAEDYYYNSPYAFSENQVVAHVELEGLEKSSIHLKDRTAHYASDHINYTPQAGVIFNNVKPGKSLLNHLSDIGRAGDNFIKQYQTNEPNKAPEKADIGGTSLVGSSNGDGPAIEGNKGKGEIDVSMLQEAWAFGPPPGAPANTADVIKTAVSEAVNVVTNAETTVKEAKELVNKNSNTKPQKPDSIDIEITVINGTDTSTHVERRAIN